MPGGLLPGMLLFWVHDCFCAMMKMGITCRVDRMGNGCAANKKQGAALQQLLVICATPAFLFVPAIGKAQSMFVTTLLAVALRRSLRRRVWPTSSP